MNAFESYLSDVGAIYRWDGTPESPHCILTSGRHSPFFINGTMLLDDPAFTRTIAKLMIERSQLDYLVDTHKKTGKHRNVRIIGQAMGSIVLAYYIAEECKALSGFSEKLLDGSMAVSRFALDPSELVLVIEDVFTTGLTTAKTFRAVKARGCNVYPRVFCIANRSGDTSANIDGDEMWVNSLVDMPKLDHPADDCPACKAGSKAYKPKAHWSLFTKR